MSSNNVPELTREQQQMLEQFKEMFNLTDDAAAIATLQSVHWCMERAVETHFRNENNVVRRQQERDEEEREAYIDVDDDEDLEEVNVAVVFDEEEVPRNDTNTVQSLLPLEYTSLTEALTKFTASFLDRHGAVPAFFNGEIQSLIQTAFVQARREDRRPIVLYLNHESSVASSAFAPKVLMEPSIAAVLREKFVLFPWDCTKMKDVEFILEVMENAGMGPVRTVLQRVYRRGPSAFPVLMVVTRKGKIFKVAQRISCNDEIEEMVEKLNRSFDNYVAENIQEEAEEKERQERQRLRIEQETEYRKSLATDMARLEKRKLAEERKRLEELKQAQEEEEVRRAEEEETARREKVAATLPEEPAATETDIVTVKFRLPENGQEMRRFRKSEKIQTIVDFLSSKGFEETKFKYVNSDFPKKNILEHFDVNASIGDSKWPAREQIFVEEHLDE